MLMHQHNNADATYFFNLFLFNMTLRFWSSWRRWATLGTFANTQQRGSAPAGGTSWGTSWDTMSQWKCGMQVRTC